MCIRDRIKFVHPIFVSAAFQDKESPCSPPRSTGPCPPMGIFSTPQPSLLPLPLSAPGEPRARCGRGRPWWSWGSRAAE
eukprot:2922671-Pyramimonas_sp.AAC.1